MQYVLVIMTSVIVAVPIYIMSDLSYAYAFCISLPISYIFLFLFFFTVDYLERGKSTSTACPIEEEEEDNNPYQVRSIRSQLQPAPTCPQCQSDKVAQILYGQVPMTQELQTLINEKRVILGGCAFSENLPTWSCTDCQHQFS